MDPSPRDHQWSTCTKWELKWKAGWATRGVIGIIRSSSWLTRNRFRSWSSSGCRDDRNLHRMDVIASCRDGQISIGRATKEHQRDRGAIAIRRPLCSRSFSHHSNASGRLDPHRTGGITRNSSRDRDRPTYLIRSDGSDFIGLTIVAHDRGSIVVRSLSNRGPIAP